MTRALRVLAALAVALTGLVLFTQAPASACSCAQADLDRLVKRADVVFVGTIEEATLVDTFRYEYTVSAERAYKGSVERDVAVTSSASSAACGLGELTAGTDYLFLARGTSSPYATNLCSGSGPAGPGRLEKLEAVTGKGTRIDPPPPPAPVITRVEQSPPDGFAKMAAPGGALALVGLLGLLVVRRLSRR